MYCSERDNFGFCPSTARKNLTDIDNIAALPVSQKTRIYLISAKVIPQMSFGTHISKIPKKDLATSQNSIARALWINQPKWRSKSLLQAILSQPHRTDPAFATAYSAIFELVRMCHTAPWILPKLQRTLQSEARAKHSLANSLLDAAELLHIQLDQNFGISFAGCKPVNLQDVHPKDIRKALQQVVRHACYTATPPTRKDFSRPTGILDHKQSTRFLVQKQSNDSCGTPDASRFESICVGCVLTNDRLASTGWTDNSLCRFCNATKESLPHLLECENLHELIGPPVQHEFGNNFMTMGHIHHPKFIARKRLLCLSARDLESSVHFEAGAYEKLWTDGSVIYADCFWLRTATYAIVDSCGHVRKQGQVNHWNLAELWAVVTSCALATQPTIVHSDCLTVVQQASEIFDGKPVHQDWACKEWWNFLFQLFHLRTQQCSQPFVIRWIPAHCLDTLSEVEITEAMAMQKKTTRENILNNRKADQAARFSAKKLAPVHPDMQTRANKAIDAHHAWLVSLHKLLPTSDPGDPHVKSQDTGPADVPLDQCKLRFPSWHWHLPKKHFPWKPKIPLHMKCPTRWAHTGTEWRTRCAFLRQLSWVQDAEQSYSFTELAAVFHASGFKLDGDTQLLTFFDMYKIIRERMQYMSKQPDCDCFPGRFDSTFPRSCGRVLPQGCIRGGIPYVTDSARLLIARLFQAGAGKTIDSWRLPLADF